jgi:Zn-dependent protease with chaperone function
VFPIAIGILYAPVAIWVATGVGLLVAFRASAPALVLRLAACFLGLWAILATTVLVWVLANGGWPGMIDLARSPLLLFESRFAQFWLEGASGALLVFTVAFLLNQAVGRGFLSVLRTEPIPWPAHLARPRERTSLLAFGSPRVEAFSFTLLEPPGAGRRWPHRHEVILLSRGLLRRLDPAEREAAIAHELGHVSGLDGRYLTFVRTLARMMRWDPLLAYLAWRLTSREEFRADAAAARMTQDPLALARALFKALVASETEGGARATRAMAALVGGAPTRRRRREALERIRRLMALAESPEFRAPSRDG